MRWSLSEGLLDGTSDPTWRGRHGERNALFADLVVYTGMRLGETASMLACEVPQFADRATGALQVPAAVAKRGEGPDRVRQSADPPQTAYAAHPRGRPLSMLEGQYGK